MLQIDHNAIKRKGAMDHFISVSTEMAPIKNEMRINDMYHPRLQGTHYDIGGHASNGQAVCNLRTVFFKIFSKK